MATNGGLEAAAEHAPEVGGQGIHVALSAEKLGDFLGIPITNTLITAWITILLLITIGIIAGGRLRMIPGKFQTLLEWMFGGLFDYIAETLESKEMARRFFPLIMTIFLFIFTANILHFVPGIGSIGFYHNWELVPLLRSVNTDLNVPLALAIISFLVVEFTGIFTLGIMNYGSKFLVNPLRSPIGAVVGFVELIGELVRVVSLSFRLFGNILAGEIIILVAIYFAPYFAPVPLMLFETFVGFLQAAIFALLTLFFIKLAIQEPHGEAVH